MTNNLLYFLSPHHNRSVIAEAWAEKSKLANWSFISSSWDGVMRDPLSIKAMQEVNIDLTTKPTQQLNNVLLEKASCIIAIYDFQNDPVPPLPSRFKNKLVQWNIPAPLKTSIDDIEKWAKYQEVCDTIAVNVKDLEGTLNFTY
ncbi:low molecular weight phosphatase family protein [Lederbergia lenta]|uniref:Arsenate reductase (Thioredoxin) n=1 Tax=Lederbergia lenta TaxID=1467 RepID=A0A2X4Z9J0_LEDLE|nr:hypothetical protein [Lederbergia lenta]MCM3110541.1 low molecular weight phosphatase family protein [Lederbergia lenta]MEC2323893.1 low molecular weight phosphatase family protein [Lederbergia lenta]SQI61075.1 arsenate reductase (thioredoxin) [Lederbergia lenta]